MKNTKKLSLIISTYDDIKNPYYGGGGAIAVHELAKRLNHTYTIRVLCWNYSGKKHEKIAGVEYERFGFPFLGPKLAMFFYQLFLPFFASTRHYDLWLESFCPPFTTSFLPMFTKKPVVGIVHMLAAEDMERKYKLPFHILETLGIKKYKNIIVTTEFMKEKIRAMHPSGSVSIISNGIDKVFSENSQRMQFVLFLGRIEVDQKGLDLLIPAFKKCNRENKNTFTLVIAGDGDKREVAKLKQIITNYSLSQSVVLTGRVSGEKKEILLRSAACQVVPSRFETYSIAALEAMAHMTPLVSFDIEGLSWVSSTIAKKVKPFEVDKLAEAISQVVTDAKMSDTMISAGKEYAKKFTWDAIAVQYEAYVRSILGVRG